MKNRRFGVLAIVLGLAPASSVLAAPGPVHVFDAAQARPAELAREAQASPAGALFRVTGLRGADGEPLTLDLEIARLFADDFHLYVDGRDRGGDLADRLTFLRGTVEEMPASSVSLTLDGASGAWSGTIATGAVAYEIEVASGARDKALALAAEVRPAPAEPLARSLVSDALNPPSGAFLFEAKKAPKPVVPPGVSYQALIAIDSDYELFHVLGDDVDAATGYLAAMMADVAELYVRQLGVSLAVTSLSLYTNPNDPWNAPNPHSGETADVLCEFSNFWQKNRPLKNFPRNAAIFFTGKRSNDIGGQAWLSSLCSFGSRVPANCPYGGYGIIVIGRHRPFETVATAHELGHVFGTQHTHCYVPPIDRCHSGEDGCYSGEESTPADGGSVMSYCAPATLNLGEAGRFGVDSQRVRR